jgi:hypothetical protein
VCPGNSGACVSSDETGDGSSKYFINGADPQSLITCTNGGTCLSASALSDFGLYVDGTDNSYTINCSPVLGGCTSAKALSQCDEGTDTNTACKSNGSGLNNGYYISSENGMIYKSTASSCTKQPDEKTYVFELSSTPSYVDVGEGDGAAFKVYTCRNGVCTQLISSSYLESSTSTLYYCDENGDCTEVSNSVAGFYLSGAPSIVPKQTYYTYTDLIKCTGTNVAENCGKGTLGKGYYINSDGTDGMSVLSCDGLTCKLLADSQNTLCTGRIGGVKVSGGKKYLCQNSTDEDDATNQVEIKPGATKATVTFGVTRGVFPGYNSANTISVVVDTDGSALLEEKEGSFAIECNVKTGIICKDGSYVLDDTTLYFCETQGIPCEPVTEVGYYIQDTSTIYYCKVVSGQLKCDMEEDISSEESCDLSLVGKIATIDSQLSICLTSDLAIPLIGASKGTYVVAYKSGGIFGLRGHSYQEDYAIISVTENAIRLDTTYANNVKYIYADKSATGKYKILTRKDTCPTTKDAQNMMELSCLNGLCVDLDRE